MQTITCDVCKKKIDNSMTGRNFFYYAEYSICEPCKDNLELNLKGQVRGRDPFSYEWYTKYVNDAISKSVSKGK